MTSTTTAIARTTQPKAGLEQESGSDASEWRTAFCAGRALLTDELKQQHLALGDPLANTVGIQGYVEPDKAVMQPLNPLPVNPY